MSPPRGWLPSPALVATVPPGARPGDFAAAAAAVVLDEGCPGQCSDRWCSRNTVIIIVIIIIIIIMEKVKFATFIRIRNGGLEKLVNTDFVIKCEWWFYKDWAEISEAYADWVLPVLINVSNLLFNAQLAPNKPPLIDSAHFINTLNKPVLNNALYSSRASRSNNAEWKRSFIRFPVKFPKHR